MKAGNQKNTLGFHLVKQAIRKAPNSRPPALPIDDRKARGKLRNELDGVFDRLDESL